MNQPTGHPADFAVQPKRVLCYGHDAILSRSRRRILELAGCPCATAGSDAEFREELHSGCPGVIIFCQTILPADGVAAAAFAHAHCPTALLLLLYIERRKFVPVQEHRFFQAGQSPSVFAATVFRMLYSPGTAECDDPIQ